MTACGVKVVIMNKNWNDQMNNMSLNGIRAAFLSLGCKVNSYETEAMKELFRKAGAVLTRFGEPADVYVINTCTVTNIADRKSRQMLHRARHLNPEAVIVAAGCYVQSAGSALLADRSVDLLVGNNQKKRIKFDYVPRPNNEFLLSVDSNDAGSALKALRVYDNMQNGMIQIEARRRKDKTFIGHAKIRNFSIYNTPIIAKLLTVASFSGMVNLLTGEGIAFSHFDAPFEYKDKVFTVSEGKAFGNVIGITMEGTYNRNTDYLKGKGVIVPAYSINSFIGKIPVIGNILSGKDGSVFAANYSVKGEISDPEVKINPLSALTPSSLKDLFSSLFESKNDVRISN